MKIKHLNKGATIRGALITFETDAERALTKDQLLLIVDNAQGIKYDHTRGAYDLVGTDFGGARHFGGVVKPVEWDPNSREVLVYID